MRRAFWIMLLGGLLSQGEAMAQLVDVHVDLSADSLAAGYVVAEGDWSVTEGELRQSDSAAHPAKLFFPTPVLTDFEFSAAFKISKSARSVRSADFLFRARDTANYVYFHCNSQQGMVAFARATDSAYWTVPKRHLEAGVTAGVWHQARITGEGGVFVFYLDDEEVARASHSNLAVGSLGLGACSAHVTFKDIRIRGTRAAEAPPFRIGSSRHILVAEGSGDGLPDWSPSLRHGNDGALLLTHSAAPTADAATTKQSSDSGLNWQKSDTVPPALVEAGTEAEVSGPEGRLTIDSELRVRHDLAGEGAVSVSSEPLWPGTNPVLMRCSSGDVILFVECEGRGLHALRSSDFGKTWQGPTIVCGDGYGRADALELADGSVLIAHGRTKSASLVVSRLDVRGPQLVPVNVGMALPPDISGIPLTRNGATIVAPAIARVNPRNTEGSIVSLRDGRLLLAYTRFYGGGGDHALADISGMTSNDGGHTWSRPFLIQRNDAGCNVMSASLLRLDSGEILLGYLRKETSSSDCRFHVRLSTDEGETWGGETCATPEPVEYYVVNNDRVIQLRSGRLVVPAADHADWHRRKQGWAVCYLSDDRGKTWRRGRGHIELPGCGCQEPGVVELKDGRVYMIIRNSMGSVYKAYSEDGGDTWSEGVTTGLVAPVAPASIKRIPTTGDLLLIWNHAEKRRVPLASALSSDEGETWHHIRDIEPTGASFAYTSIIFRDQTAVLSYWTSIGGLSMTVRCLPIDWFYGK